MPAPLDRRFHGRVAVVTGAAHGIGAATVARLAAEGAEVLAADLDGGGALAVAEQVAADGGVVHAIEVDVTDDAGVDHLRRTCLDRLGTPHVLVNNVGHHLGSTPFTDQASDPPRWQRLLDVNVWHVLAVTKAFVAEMCDAGRGSIVNVSSVEGLRGFPRDPVYAAWKGAVNAFTTSLAVEVGPAGVRVNAVAPDLTESAQVPYADWIGEDEAAEGWPRWAPLGGPVQPDEQAAVIAFLASDDAARITGTVVPVDSGTLAAGGWVRPAGAPRWTNRP